MILKAFRLVSRFILGLVFIFSGFVKAVDPLGSAYKFGDYFTAFHLDFLQFLALPLSILLSSFELVLGITLILNWRKRIAGWLLLVFMAFFTILTLILALFNPVSDCGCFGDALILTNWQTFLKNLVLMVFVLILLYPDALRKRDERSAREWGLLILVYAAVIWFSWWNYRHIPLMDFRPYDVGSIISEEMEIPEDAPVDRYETVLVYREKDSGKEEEFSIENYPRDTSKWSFVSSESHLLEKGYEPPIHDFAIMNARGDDLVDEILSDRGYTLLMLSYDLEKADGESLVRAGAWHDLESLADDFRFFAVSASTSETVEALRVSLDLDYPIQAGDEIMLKTMVRSNPGYMLIHNGCIVGKWGFRDFPSLDQLSGEAMEILENTVFPAGEEALMLMEAGVYENLNFGILEFADMVPSLLFREAAGRAERRVILTFVLSVLLVIIALKYSEIRNKL